MDIDVRINSFIQSFTRTERKVADYVLENIDRVLYMSITELAEVVGVSETTVVRFYRRIGFSGYQDFRLNIAKSQPMKTSAVNSNITERYMGLIKNSLSSLAPEDVKRAAQVIENARYIYVYGVGSSGITAMDMENRLLRLGKRAHAIIDWHMQAVASAAMDPQDVVVAVSVSGSTHDLVETLTIAKEKKVPILLITNYSKSAISKLATISLVVSAKDPPPEGGSFGPKVAQLMCIDLLCQELEAVSEETRRERTLIAEAISKKL